MKKYNTYKQAVPQYIGMALLEMHEGNYEKTYELLQAMQIHKVDYKPSFYKKEGDVTVHMDRPGLLIGKKGETIRFIEKYLSEALKREIKIDIVEDNLNQYLYPVYWNDLIEEEVV